MFRHKLQEKRSGSKKDKDIYIRNNNILAKLFNPNLLPYEEKALIKAGFNEHYRKDKFQFEDKILVIYDDFYLEELNDDKIIIHKKQ